MITEIVLFKLPAGMTRELYAARARESAPAWGANPDLVRKNYLFDAERGYGGGAYTWRSIADAQKWHGEAFRQRIKDAFGSEPTFTYYDTPILVDNEAHSIREAA
jgi:hypothetical protein